MPVHYETPREGFMRAAYLSQPKGDIEQRVRNALNMQYTQEKEPRFIDENQSYIIRCEEVDIYHGVEPASLKDSRCTVIVPKDGSPVKVGIQLKMPLSSDGLKQMIEFGIIKLKLAPAGLAPTDSKREDVLSYLEKGFFE